MTSAATDRAGALWLTGSSRWGSWLLPLLAAGAGLLVALSGAHPATAAVAAGLALVIAIAAWPAAGAFLWLLVGPLIVGIPRGIGGLPMRPNEALLLIAIVGIGLRVLWQIYRRERFLPNISVVDVAVALLVATGSVMPLLLRYGRGLQLSPDDLLYALVFIKYFILYALFRLSVSTPADVAKCLVFALFSAVVVAVVALLQVRGLFGVPELLNQYYDTPFEGAVGPITLRGTSTIASSFGLADMMAMCLAIILAWLPTARRQTVPLIFAGLLFLGGCVAAGSFSGVIGLGIVVCAIGLVTRRLLALLAVLLPTSLVAAAVFWPVVASRLEGFESYRGLPHSWIGRLANLQTFFWPELFSGFNWLIGVRPAARVAAPEHWREWVYIESGHTWLLWTGGVPLLLAFFYFFGVVLYRLHDIATTDKGPVGVAAAAGFASAAMIFVLMLFDPHLTVRGSADLFFPLLALSLAASSAGQTAPPFRAGASR